MNYKDNHHDKISLKVQQWDSYLVGNNSCLIGFKTHCNKRIHAWYSKPCQFPRAIDDMGLRGEQTTATLLNKHGS